MAPRVTKGAARPYIEYDKAGLEKLFYHAIIEDLHKL